MNQKGITLLELIIVMVIIAIGAILVTPSIGSWLPNFRLRSATRDIASAMRLAQIKAVSNNIKYGVAFDINSREYQLYYQSTGGLLPEGEVNVLPTGIQFNSVTFPVDPVLNKPFSQFNENSTATHDGNVVLTNTKGTTKRIRLLRTVGRIRIE